MKRLAAFIVSALVTLSASAGTLINGAKILPGTLPATSVSTSAVSGQTNVDGALGALNGNITNLVGLSTGTANSCQIAIAGSIVAGVQTDTLLFPPFVCLNANAAAAPSALTGSILQIIGADGTASYVPFETYGAAGEIVYRRTDGTIGSPSALGAAEPVIVIGMRGYDGSAMVTSDTAQIRCLTSQAWTSAHHGSGCAVYTTTNNTTTNHEAALFNGSGGLELFDSSGSAPTGADPGAGSHNIPGAYKVNGAMLAGSAGTTFTVTGCGTAGSVTGQANAGSFTVGTGAGTCTFTVTINGASGNTAPHGWIANADDVTAVIHCPNNGAASTTTVVFKCNSTVTTSDLIVFSATPY